MVYLYQSDAIKDMNHFFDETVRQSAIVTTIRRKNPLYRLLQVVLRGFASLL
jgi:hypothetical protein